MNYCAYCWDEYKSISVKKQHLFGYSFPDVHSLNGYLPPYELYYLKYRYCALWKLHPKNDVRFVHHSLQNSGVWFLAQ